jgi:hypothetical protein
MNKHTRKLVRFYLPQTGDVIEAGAGQHRRIQALKRVTWGIRVDLDLVYYYGVDYYHKRRPCFSCLRKAPIRLFRRYQASYWDRRAVCNRCLSLVKAKH